MTTSRDPERLIHAFVREGAEQLDDQVYDAVRAEIEQKRQRVVIGPWRVPTMSKLMPIGLAAAAVIAVLVIGTQLLGSPSSAAWAAAAPVGMPPTATPSPSASSRASPPPLNQTFTSQMHGSPCPPRRWTARAPTSPGRAPAARTSTIRMPTLTTRHPTPFAESCGSSRSAMPRPGECGRRDHGRRRVARHRADRRRTAPPD